MDEKRHSVDCTKRAMTKKRWIVLAGMLAACVGLTLAVLALLPAGPGVTPANIERIENGMTQAEVEEILGSPGMLGRPWVAFPSDWGPVPPINAERVTMCLWDNPHDGINVAVFFDRDNRVTGRMSGPPETFLQKLRRLLHL
jgi:hypothetical protein